MKGLVFDTENQMQFKDFGEPLLDNLQKEVGGCIEVVHPKYLPEGLCMVIDDEGLLKGYAINSIASILYGTPEHGQPIVGTAVILREGFVAGELDFMSLDDGDEVGLISKRKMRKSSPPSRWWCSDGLAPRQICRRFSAAAAARICASSSGRASTGLCRMPRLRVCSPRLCPAAQPRHRLEVARHEVEKTIPQPDRVRFVCDGWLHPRKHGLLPAGGRVGNRAGYLRQPFSELADAGD